MHNFGCRVERGGKAETRTLPDTSEYLDYLKEVTGIELDASYDALGPVPASSTSLQANVQLE